ncbi:MAG: site-2 protease family protein, partial [Thermoproteota archaeon]
RYSTPITLTEYEDRAVMGVSLANLNTQEVLNLYRKVTPSTLTLYLIPPSFAQGQYLVPFSNYLAPFYTHSLIPNWQTYANIFFWIWFVNINVAVFNALPIYPFDGGRMLNILLKKHLPPKISKENIPNITYTITAAIISVLILNIIIPYLL